MAKIRKYEEIMKGALANMIAKQDKVTDFNEGSVIHTILDTISRIAERAYVAIRQGYNELLAILPFSLFKFEKKVGLRASGTVVFSRETPLSSQSIIAKGTKVSGGGLFFITTKAGVIPPGGKDSDPIEVIADGTGTDYNAAVGIIDTIESVVPSDVVLVKNELAITGGTDEETDAEFSERFKIFINGLSGTNNYGIRSAALSVNEVRSVSVQNHKPPLKDIYNLSVYVDDGSGGATQETLDKVKFAIEGDQSQLHPGHLAPGINMRVITPTAIPVNVEINATVFSMSIEEAKLEIEKTVSQYINGLTVGEKAIISEIVKKVMDLNFITDVEVVSPESNVEPAVNQIARVGAMKVSVVEV